VSVASLGEPASSRRRTLALTLTLVLALGAGVALTRLLETSRLALRAATADEAPYLAP
jgi:hypothetical protein